MYENMQNKGKTTNVIDGQDNRCHPRTVVHRQTHVRKEGRGNQVIKC
jgi:hypothetical protein